MSKQLLIISAIAFALCADAISSTFPTTYWGSGIAENYIIEIWQPFTNRLNTYSGAAMRVRRDSDDAEQDIGYTSGRVLDTNDLASFCGAANGYVVILYGGLGKHATNNVDASQPKIWNGSEVMDGVYFDGDDYLVSESEPDYNSEWERFSLNAWYRWPSWEDGTGDTNFGFRAVAGKSNTWFSGLWEGASSAGKTNWGAWLHFDTSGTDDSYVSHQSLMEVETNWSLLSTTHGSLGNYIYLDDGSLAGFGSGVGANVTNIAPVTIGRRFVNDGTTNDWPFKGHIGTLILYKKELSDSEIGDLFRAGSGSLGTANGP